MLYKTKGIVLNYLKYGDSSIIVRVYTELFGIQSYVVNGVRSSRSKSSRMALFQPLTLLDMVVYHKDKADALNRLSEVRTYHPFYRLPFEMVRTSLGLFISELLGKCLRQEESDPLLFQFLESAVISLDETTRGLESFHLGFLCHFSGYLGFGIHSPDDFYDSLRDAHYPGETGRNLKEAFRFLLNEEYDSLRTKGKRIRSSLLAQLLFYYRINLEGFGEMRSQEVLQAVLR